MDCSVFKSALSTIPAFSVSLENLIETIKDGSFKEVVDNYRRVCTREEKIKIPCFTPCGLFTRRSIDNVEKYNPILCIDIDYKDNLDVDFDFVFNKLKNNKFIRAMHKSVSGKGYAVYIEVDNTDLTRHGEVYAIVAGQFNKSLGVNVDMACTDISRLRFLSYDEDAFYNGESEILIVELPVVNKPRSSVDNMTSDEQRKYTLQALQLALRNSADIADTYDNWLKVVYCISSVFGEDGRSICHEVCAISPKYSYRDTDRLYSKALRRASRTSTSTLFYLLKQKGIYHSLKYRT